METVSRDLLREAEEPEDEEEPDPTEGEDTEWELANRIVFNDRFQRLPTKFDVHEWNIMQEFSNSVSRDHIREELLDAIHGAGAFRSFKSAIRRHNIESAWYACRTEVLRQIAIDWCEEHHIPWE